MRKRSVCWNITSRCNSNCEFCYKNIDKSENSLVQNTDVIKFVSEIGIDKITFSGGECLLYPDLLELLKISHNLNMTNSIITNGKVLNEETIKKLEKYVDYIIFSIDAINENINKEIGRGELQGKNVLDWMRYITKSNTDMEIKLNTVINRKNLNEISIIADSIRDIPIVRWKLFKFCGLRGSSVKNYKKYSISDEEYDKVVNSININCRIERIKEKDIEENYFLIDSAGNFCITKNLQDEIICNYKNADISKVKELLWS